MTNPASKQPASTTSAGNSNNAPAMTEAQASDALGVPIVQVRRLISIELLKATKVGGKKYLILASEFSRFIAAGAPGLDSLPPFSRDWFNPQETLNQAMAFRKQVTTILDAKKPDLAAVQSRIDSKPESKIEIDFKAQDFQQAIAAAVPRSPLPPYEQSRFQTMGQIFMADSWRALVYQQLNQNLGSANLARLYDPEEFRPLLDSTYEQLLKRRISVTEAFNARVKGGTLLVSVSLGLPLSSLAQYVPRKDLEAVTF